MAFRVAACAADTVMETGGSQAHAADLLSTDASPLP